MLTLQLMLPFKTGANICNNLNPESLREGIGNYNSPQKAGRGLGLAFLSALSPQDPPMWAL